MEEEGVTAGAEETLGLAEEILLMHILKCTTHHGNSMLLSHSTSRPELKMLPRGHLCPMDKEDKFMTEDSHGQWEIRTSTVLISLRINNEGA